MNSNLKINYRKNETDLVTDLIDYIKDSKFLIPSVEYEAYKIAEKIRNKSANKLKLENLMNMYPLYSSKGRNMMSLSEALLRIPDTYNQEKLIIEKIKGDNWSVSLIYGFPLYLASHIMNLGSKMLPKNNKGIFSKLIVSTARLITRFIIQTTSYQFVLSQNMKNALKKSKSLIDKGYSFSYDMLGESARTDEDAKKYYAQYADSITQCGEFSKKIENPKDVSISIKLSSLHSRYEVAQFEKIKPILYERLLGLCELAAKYDLLLFIDAEEAERLELSLELIDNILAEPSLKDWYGLGLAVQCYQKRGFYTIDVIADLSKKYNKKIYVRLVKGAYWDAEIKLDQINGVSDFSLFTRKEHTDIAYMACAKKMSLYENEIYPCFATHNAFSISYVREIMKGKEYEFQCLQGMGDNVYDDLVATKKIRVRKYAPVGKFNHLLPYLVRRLIENGAKSSFINQVLHKDSDLKEITKNPVTISNELGNSRHPLIKLPRDIFISEQRKNSKGVDMAQLDILKQLENDIKKNDKKYSIYSILNGVDVKNGEKVEIKNPAKFSEILGEAHYSNEDTIVKALSNAYDYFPTWNKTPVEKRAKILERVADELENQTSYFVSILVKEAGKTIRDSILEVREAVDFLRYYAKRAVEEFSEGIDLPGPIGESNKLSFEGRGVFLCIAPWNFPLAIYLGQISAALVSGNTVLAKPAESTTIIGYEAVKLMISCGLPAEAIQYLPARGKLVGDHLLENSKLSGVAFTGSDATAKAINKKIANRSSNIIPLIAETGGQNAMIVDSTALAEQVTRDVLNSAFQSAGQRCSALRVMFVQDDVADNLIKMISDAMDELSITDPSKMNCDVGSVINKEAHDRLTSHVEYMADKGKLIKELPLNKDLNGYYFAPRMYEIESIEDLKTEVFGPILHVIRYNIKDIEKLANQVNSTGYGLTFCIHSRLDKNIELFKSLIRAGNIYVNRNQIGAVVSSQPFGGMGNSGTGPKAGGPLYLHKFSVEKTISTDLTAWGGDIKLMSEV